MNLDVKQRIQDLAVDISESGDENLAWKLLTVADVLQDYEKLSNKAVVLVAYQEIWRYGLLETIIEILKDDFDGVKGGWTTAAKLAKIVAECIANVGKIHQELEFASNAVETLLLVASTQQQKFLAIFKNDSSKAEARQMLNDFRTTLNGATRLATNISSLGSLFLQSPLLLHMLITENTESAHLVLTSIQNLVQFNPDILRRVDSVIISNLLDEIVFKISSTQDPLIACSAIRVGLSLANVCPDRVLPLFIAQYAGLRPLIGKWKRQGFDDDVERLLALLDDDQEKLLIEQGRNDAASRIQAHWRGYQVRKQMKASQNGITKFQRMVRAWLQKKRDKKRTTRFGLLVQQAREDQYRQEMRQTMTRQMELLQHVPAGKVEEYLVERETRAATVLQSCYRGLLARRELSRRKALEERDRAARCIQRRYRRILKKRQLGEKREGVRTRLGFDITEERRRELEEKIAVGRERFPYRFESIDALRELHKKAQGMVGEFLANFRKYRDEDVRRRALVARLQSDAEQFLGAPPLAEAQIEHVEAFSSGLGPVTAMAQRAHTEELRAARLPWWKRVPLEEDVDLAELGCT